MKRIAHALLLLAVLAALTWALWKGWTARRAEYAEGHAEEAAEEATKPEDGKKEEPADEHEEAVVELSPEKAKAVGIETATLEKSELARSLQAFGRVIDPTPLVTLDADLASAEAALAASRAEFERSQKLLAAGENTSRKLFESAEAQFRADEIKARNLKRQARMQWGTALPDSEGGKRHAFVEALVQGDAALVRADLLPANRATEAPQSATVFALGRENEPVPVASISPAAEIDPRVQAEAFILTVQKPPFPLRPGAAITAQLNFGGEKRAGYIVPRSAILRHDGRVWIYVKEKDKDEFVRKPVELDSALAKGWFVEAEHAGLEPDDAVVVRGAQILLSNEMKAAAGTAEE